jgi:hypothetical protein
VFYIDPTSVPQSAAAEQLPESTRAPLWTRDMPGLASTTLNLFSQLALISANGPPLCFVHVRTHFVHVLTHFVHVRTHFVHVRIFAPPPPLPIKNFELNLSAEMTEVKKAFASNLRTEE